MTGTLTEVAEAVDVLTERAAPCSLAEVVATIVDGRRVHLTEPVFCPRPATHRLLYQCETGHDGVEPACDRHARQVETGTVTVCSSGRHGYERRAAVVAAVMPIGGGL